MNSPSEISGNPISFVQINTQNKKKSMFNSLIKGILINTSMTQLSKIQMIKRKSKKINKLIENPVIFEKKNLKSFFLLFYIFSF